MAPSARYTKLAILLHWIIAAGMIANVVLVLSVDSVPKAWERPFIDTHKSIGITVLGLAILRVLWRLSHPPPAFPANYPRSERKAAHAVHYLLYALMFLLPLSGWVHDSAWKGAPAHPMFLWGVIPWFRFGFVQALPAATKEHVHDISFLVHSSLAYGLYALFALHLAGALKHQFIDREPELQRMLPE